MTLVPAKLAKVILADERDEQVVVIAEEKGNRYFPISIGVFEAIALQRRLHDAKGISRPLTHDLVANCISALGGQLLSVRIVNLEDGTFFAELVIETSDGEVVVDCRPSDALVLASEQLCPLEVDEEIFRQSAL
ncbi:MAG: bifunctional nuclease family protein [Planctomycetes bacterium]|nr:bifunctional nuclease family protein [Planctomycetota bacterium]